MQWPSTCWKYPRHWLSSSSARFESVRIFEILGTSTPIDSFQNYRSWDIEATKKPPRKHSKPMNSGPTLVNGTPRSSLQDAQCPAERPFALMVDLHGKVLLRRDHHPFHSRLMPRGFLIFRECRNDNPVGLDHVPDQLVRKAFHELYFPVQIKFSPLFHVN